MATPDRLGDFEIIEEIGRGGFGVVYRARQLSLDRPVAVKVLFRHLIHTQDQITRFEREARAAARLDHPAIVSVYAWGQDADDFYIAQRLVGHGRTLADEITTLKSLGSPPKGHFRRVAEVVARIAEGLQQAHDRGIVHRDVKPSNILLDENDQPCLGDFGLAKMEGGALDLSRTGDFAGSPYFMSPEQADSKRGVVDHRSDVYSLGVTLYELLTLTQPFQGDTPHEIVRRILGEDPRRPRRFESRVPQDLETICLHAMEKNPAQRYPSALEFAHDLNSFLDGEPISAVPIGLVRRGLRSMRRHREPVAWALLAGLLVGGGTWAAGMLSSNKEQSQQVDSAKAESLVQRKHVEEIGQIQDTFSEKIQAAAAQQDPAKVTKLVQEQQLFTSMFNENYAWVSGQLAELGDTKSLNSVAAGVATGGLYGGLQSLQQVLVSRKAAQERDALMGEVNRRMTDLASHLLEQGDPVAAAPAASSVAEPPVLLVPVSGDLYLLIRGVAVRLPAGAAAPAIAPASVPTSVPAKLEAGQGAGAGTGGLAPGSPAPGEPALVSDEFQAPESGEAR